MRSLQFCVTLSTLLFFADARQISRLFDESVRSEVEASPFHIELVPSQNSGSIQAIITNKGSESTYYPLSKEDILTKLQLYDINDEPVAKVNPQGHDHVIRSLPQYQKLEAGQSITQELEIISNYELQPEEQYFVQVGGFMPYYVQGQSPETAESQHQMFEADIYPFVAPSNLPVRHIRIPQTSNLIVATCTDKEMDAKMIKSIPHAIEQTKKSIAYVQSGTDRSTMKNFFKNDDPETRKTVIDRLTAVLKALESKTGPGRVQCAENSASGGKSDMSWCKSSGAVAMTDAQNGKVTICPLSKRFAVEFKRCGDSNWGGTLIHELTHSRVVFKPITVDAAYGLAQCKALSPARALLNANSYNFLADSVMQNKSC